VLLIFIVGDILGGGIYALVGEVGGEVGGAIWTAFLLALVLAAFTAAAYAELATKYPRGGGAAHYVNRAFGLPLLTFLVTFAVMASGISSAEHARPRLRRRLPERVRRADGAGGARVHRPRRARQLPRHRRVGCGSTWPSRQ
jgi:hypothetical protein